MNATNKTQGLDLSVHRQRSLTWPKARREILRKLEARLKIEARLQAQGLAPGQLFQRFPEPNPLTQDN